MSQHTWYVAPAASELPVPRKPGLGSKANNGPRTVLGELNSNRAPQGRGPAPAKKFAKADPNAENIPPFANAQSTSSSLQSWKQPSGGNSNVPFKIHVDQPARSTAYEAEDAPGSMPVENRLMALPESADADFWADKIASLPQIPTLQQIEKQQGRRAPLRPLSVSDLPSSRNAAPLQPMGEEDDEFSIVTPMVVEDSPMVLDESVMSTNSANASTTASPSESGDVTSSEVATSSELTQAESTVSKRAREDDEESRQEEQLSEYEDSKEYFPDIYHSLVEKEAKYAPKWNYMEKQGDISFQMRCILVDWLVEVAEEYKLHQETIHLTVNFIDRFLSYMSVQRPKLQLVGTACMFIAAKYEEIYPPDVGEFVYITDDTYSKKQVLRMEQLVLKVLAFELSGPTSLVFVNLFAKASDCDQEVTHLAQYLSELALMDAKTFLGYRPSVVGAASVALARHTLGLCAWPVELERFSQLDVEVFKTCLIELHKTFSNMPTLTQQAIREKYSTPRFLGVSNVEPTPIF